MSNLLDNLRISSRALVVVVFVAAVSPAATGAPAPEAAGDQPGCARACPCESRGAPDAESDAEGDEGDHSPHDAPCGEDGECPAGCTHCSCCPGAAVATLTAPSPLARCVPSDGAAPKPRGSLRAGVPPRIFRPPQSALC